MGSPFKRLTKRMIMELPPANDFWLNYWCSSSGVSPRQLITGIQLDAKKHCKFQFRDYALAFLESNSKMKERAINGIFVRPTGTPCRVFWVLNLVTGEQVRKIRAQLVHTTEVIISRVEQLGKDVGMPKGMFMLD